eukprot:1147825-Pelagomonas_calceolata.AAC.2
MRSYHTHLGIPGWALYQAGWIRGSGTTSICYPFTYNKTFLINYYAISHALAFPATTFEWKPNGIMEVGAYVRLKLQQM